MNESHCQAVADVARRFGRRCRLRLRSEVGPELWGRWLIAPSAGYLEAEGGGPWAWRELEWVEVDVGEAGAGPAAEALAVAGLAAEVAEGVARILCR